MVKGGVLFPSKVGGEKKSPKKNCHEEILNLKPSDDSESTNLLLKKNISRRGDLYANLPVGSVDSPFWGGLL